MSVLFVTGTGTGVGKTVATAAIAACAGDRRVAIVKLAQTGVTDGAPGDLAEITRLTGITDTQEFARYPDPLSPHHAALRSGRPMLDLGEAVLRIADLNRTHDLVLVEGAGGVLVPYDDLGLTMIDIAHELEAAFVVVTEAGLGTLNHTALTVCHLHAEVCEIAGVVLGSWPDDPDLAMRCNVADLARMAPNGELAGALPSGLPGMPDFPRRVSAALAPALGGTFDYRAFREAARP